MIVITIGHRTVSELPAVARRWPAILLLVPTLLAASPAPAQDPAAARLYAEAQRLEEAADAAAARQELELLVQQFPADRLAPRALLRIVELRRAAGEPEAVEAAVEQLLANYARTPEAAAAFNVRAELRVGQARQPADLEEARTTFRRVPLLYGREAYPTLMARSQARIRTAELSLLLGDPEDAAAELVAVIEDEPPSPRTGRAQLRLGALLLAGGEEAAAAEILQRLANAGDEVSTIADRAHAGRLLSLFHRLVLRPRTGQRQWLTSGRFPPSGLTLREPVGVAASEAGRVVIVDRRLPLVALVDGDGRELGRSALRDVGNPGWLPDGRVFVVSDDEVILPFAGGRRLAFSDPRSGREGGLRKLVAAARGPFGDWFLAARGWKSLLRFTTRRQGRELLAGSRPELKDLARDPLGRVYALDAEAAQVVRLGIDGRSQGTVVRGAWKKPEALAVDPLGHLYVLDRASRQVEVFAPDGRRLTRVGPHLGGGVELRQPVDLSVDGSGRLFIADGKLPFIVVLE